MAVWAPQAVLGRWEMRIQVLPEADPATIVGMELLPAGALGKRTPGLGEGPHLNSRMVAQLSAPDAAPGWRHWAIERTASSTRLFLDGRLLQESPLTPDPASAGTDAGLPVQLRLWVQSSPDVGTVPARAELEWVAFYPADGS